jgi:hypothetical protein
MTSAELPRFTATIELITPTRALVELHDQAGNWFGGQSFDCRAGFKALYEQGYIEACVSARAHGGIIDTYKWG